MPAKDGVADGALYRLEAVREHQAAYTDSLTPPTNDSGMLPRD